MSRPAGSIIGKNLDANTSNTSGIWTVPQVVDKLAAGKWQSSSPWGDQSYQIERSLRFNSADSAYLNRTPASASNRRTWTWSAWVKRTALDSQSEGQALFDTQGGDVNTNFIFQFDDGGGTGGADTSLGLHTFGGDVFTTSALYRDVSAWYHIVLAIDTTQATSDNRIKLYVNGSQVTLNQGANWPAQNFEFGINTTQNHAIGRHLGFSGYYLDGYLTEIHFIDGQALDPSYFGEFSTDTGVWGPIAYTGTYGTNGFFLNFSDNSGVTSTTLGKDQVGSNNWTPNGFSVTAGAGNDSLVDVPTLFGTDTGVGGQVRGNYCTLNPLDQAGSLSNGNLEISTTSASWTQARGTLGISSGKWYWETTVVSGTNYLTGISKSTGGSEYPGANADGWGYSSATLYNNNNGSNYGASYTSGDVIGVALDLDAGTLTFYKNGISQTQAASSLTGTWFPSVAVYASSGTTKWALNAGQRPFAYTAPSGFKALVTTNLPDPTVIEGDEYFNTVVYTGNSPSSQTIAVGFQPDFVWQKSRAQTYNHTLYDSVRGATKELYSNTTGAEVIDSNGLTAFTSNGFTVGSDGELNDPTGTHVAWNWNAGGSNATNTDGTITSTVRASTDSGFSIVTYTATGSVATIGHGLGTAPRMIILKGRSGTTDWFIYHASIGATKGIYLNQTGAAITSANFWNNTAPTSTVFTAGTGVGGNGVTMVAYCFAEVPGYSAFGSYTGNASTDGPFQFLGFRPAFVMIKRTDATNSWVMLDTARDTFNITEKNLYAESSGAEAIYVAEKLDILSNGFKQKQTGVSMNASGGTYIYMAFAENPFKFALAR